MHEGIFHRLIDTKKTDALMRHPNAFTLMAYCAAHARRPGQPEEDGLHEYECICSYSKCGLDSDNGKPARKLLLRRKLVSTRIKYYGTKKVTIVKIITPEIWDISFVRTSEHIFWWALKNTEKTHDLLRHPNAFTLLASCMVRARRPGQPERDGLQEYECKISYAKCGLDSNKGRPALNLLLRWKLVSTRMERYGRKNTTIVKITTPEVWDISFGQNKDAWSPDGPLMDPTGTGDAPAVAPGRSINRDREAAEEKKPKEARAASRRPKAATGRHTTPELSKCDLYMAWFRKFSNALGEPLPKGMEAIYREWANYRAEEHDWLSQADVRIDVERLAEMVRIAGAEVAEATARDWIDCAICGSYHPWWFEEPFEQWKAEQIQHQEGRNARERASAASEAEDSVEVQRREAREAERMRQEELERKWKETAERVEAQRKAKREQEEEQERERRKYEDRPDLDSL